MESLKVMLTLDSYRTIVELFKVCQVVQMYENLKGLFHALPEILGGGSTPKKAIPPKNPELALAFFSLNVKNCSFLLKKDVNQFFLLFNT